MRRIKKPKQPFSFTNEKQGSDKRFPAFSCLGELSLAPYFTKLSQASILRSGNNVFSQKAFTFSPGPTKNVSPSSEVLLT